MDQNKEKQPNVKILMRRQNNEFKEKIKADMLKNPVVQLENMGRSRLFGILGMSSKASPPAQFPDWAYIVKKKDVIIDIPEGKGYDLQDEFSNKYMQDMKDHYTKKLSQFNTVRDISVNTGLAALGMAGLTYLAQRYHGQPIKRFNDQLLKPIIKTPIITPIVSNQLSAPFVTLPNIPISRRGEFNYSPQYIEKHILRTKARDEEIRKINIDRLKKMKKKYINQ